MNRRKVLQDSGGCGFGLRARYFVESAADDDRNEGPPFEVDPQELHVEVDRLDGT